MEKIQVQDRFETIPEIWRNKSTGQDCNYTRDVEKIQVKDRIESIPEIWRNKSTGQD